MSRRELPRDEGVALLLVLAFVLVMSVIVAALLRQSYTTLHAARVTAGLEKRIYEANGGADWAIQQIRQGALDPSGTPVCAGPSGGNQLLTSSLEVNVGRPVTVTCTVSNGRSIGAGGWAVFITDPAGTVSTNPSSQGEKTIYGPVYNEGTFTQAGGTALRVEHGDVRTVTACPGALTLDTAYGCGVSAPIANPLSPVDVRPWNIWNAAPAPLATGPGPCRTFDPGLYDAGHRPNFLSSANGTNYLRSGVYYLDDLGPLVLDDVTIVGGIAGPGDRPATTAPSAAQLDCGAQIQTPSQTGYHYGVVFVLGGTSSIELHDGARVELFGFQDGGPAGSPSLSVYQLDTEWDATPPANERSTVRGVGTSVVSTVADARTELALHGAAYLPFARVSLLGTNQSVASLSGGVVAASLDLQSNPAADHLVISNRSGAGNRTIRIEATTNSAPGEKDLRAIADVLVTNDAARSLTVTSWRVNQ